MLTKLALQSGRKRIEVSVQTEQTYTSRITAITVEGDFFYFMKTTTGGKPYVNLKGHVVRDTHTPAKICETDNRSFKKVKLVKLRPYFMLIQKLLKAITVMLNG